MCLQVFAVPATENRVRAERLARVSGLHVVKRHTPLKGAFHFSRDGGCSCSMMTDAADWNAPQWDLEPATLEGLASALTLLADEADGFRFQALWIGDTPASESRIFLRELLAEIRNNRVKNKHVYLVGKAR